METLGSMHPIRRLPGNWGFSGLMETWVLRRFLVQAATRNEVRNTAERHTVEVYRV